MSKYSKYNDIDLAKACVAQKRQAQEELYLRFSYMLKGVCLRYAQNLDEAEDNLQETFIKAFNKIATYSGNGALGGWLRRIAINTSLEVLRRNKNKLYQISDYENELDLIKVEDSTIEQLAIDDLVKKIQNLAPGYRSVFNLYAIEGYTHKEIGELLNISAGTSKSQYSKARMTLQKMIKEDDKDLEKNLNYVG